MRITPRKVNPAKTKNVAPGNREKRKSHPGPVKVFGNGRSQPPSHSVTATDETAIIAAYSPSMKSDQRKPLYSVWKPAVNSDSASGKSNGARFVSATIAMAKITNAINPSGKYLKTNQIPCSCWAWIVQILPRV